MRDLSWVAFRYFNVCGATEHCWERPYHRNRLVPVALDTAFDRIPGPMPLNGIDYQETPDHTCVRDFIHVQDIATAHCLALENQNVHGVFNLGIGHGYSNRQVIATVEQVSGRPIHVVERPRRQVTRRCWSRTRRRPNGTLDGDPSTRPLNRWSRRASNTKGHKKQRCTEA